MPIPADWRERRRRRRSLFLSAALLLVAAGSFSLIQRRRPVEPDPATTPEGPVVVSASDTAPAVIGGVPVVSLAGTPLDVGRRCGTLFKAELHSLFHDVLVASVLPAVGLSLADARKLEPGLAASIPQSMVDLLQGLADSSGLGYEDVVLAHALPEFAAAAEFAGYGATVPATRARDLLLAADWGPPAAISGLKMAVMAVDAEGLGAYVGVGPAGLIAPWLGINELGLGLAVTATARDDAAPSPEGLPVGLMALRLLQEVGDIDTARQRLDEANRTVPFEILLAQTAPKLDLAVIETTPTRLGFRAPTDGRMVVTGQPRELSKPVAADAVYDRLTAWLGDHAGELNRRLRPLHEADAYSERSALCGLAQPLTGTLGVAPAASQPLVWWQWDAAAGTLTSRDETPAGATP